MEGSNNAQEDVMQVVSPTEVLLERPEDVEAACNFCNKCGAPEVVFFVPGYPPVGRCDCQNPPRSFVKRLGDIVMAQHDVHARVGECRT